MNASSRLHLRRPFRLQPQPACAALRPVRFRER